MKYFVVLAAALTLAACGKDVTAPEFDHTCDTAKLDVLHLWFGADYSPTPNLMSQSSFNFGQGANTASFSVQNGQCVSQHSP